MSHVSIHELIIYANDQSSKYPRTQWFVEFVTHHDSFNLWHITNTTKWMNLQKFTNSMTRWVRDILSRFVEFVAHQKLLHTTNSISNLNIPNSSDSIFHMCKHHKQVHITNICASSRVHICHVYICVITYTITYTYIYVYTPQTCVITYTVMHAYTYEYLPHTYTANIYVWDWRFAGFVICVNTWTSTFRL